MTAQTFLVEIGTEELPPKALRTLAAAFADNLKNQLAESNLAHGEIHWFATPRRLAVQIKQVATRQADRQIEKRGPALTQAFDAQGNPTKAAQGWARGCGIDVEQAERLQTDKGEWLLYRALEKGQAAEQILPKLVSKALDALPIAKAMRWGTSNIAFIRPVHTVTMLLGVTLVEGKILGIDSTRTIRGHRFMGEPELILDHADHYVELLLQRGKVIADYGLRKAQIKEQIEATANRLGGRADLDEELLEEVNALVEWPVVLAARFEERFLAVPAEALVHTMKGDQKYFPLYDAAGQLLPHFIFVANIDSKDPQQVIQGNERVIRPRLADAEFFFNTDRQQRLEERLPLLETVLFQHKLGTLREKSDRIKALAGWIATQIDADVNLAIRAGLLSKCDLMTNVVFEFTDTQGVVGMHYARFDGEPEEVAKALYEQYLPRFAGDGLPSSRVSCALAIADRVDTLVGIFGIGQQPKGDKDPFALRRAALGILRIIVEKKLPLDLVSLIAEAIKLYEHKLSNNQTQAEVIDFLQGRFRAWYQDEGHSVDTILAVLARNPTRPADFDARIQAVSYFRTLPEAVALAAANKRVANILTKATDGLYPQVRPSLLKEPAEIALGTQMLILADKLDPEFAAGNYQQVLVELAALRQPVDDFFDQVMVMVPEEDLRINRLTLLEYLRQLFLKVADISLLQ